MCVRLDIEVPFRDELSIDGDLYGILTGVKTAWRGRWEHHHFLPQASRLRLAAQYPPTAVEPGCSDLLSRGSASNINAELDQIPARELSLGPWVA